MIQIINSLLLLSLSNARFAFVNTQDVTSGHQFVALSFNYFFLQFKLSDYRLGPAILSTFTLIINGFLTTHEGNSSVQSISTFENVLIHRPKQTIIQSQCKLGVT